MVARGMHGIGRNGKLRRISRLASAGQRRHTRTPMVTFEEVVQGRRSRRAFDPTRPVPDATLRAALSLAQSAPSNCNAQPWHVYVARGDTCERLRQRLTAAARSGQTPEENATPPFDGA